MLKFIWGKGQRENPERLKLQKELFGFSKVRFNRNNNKQYVMNENMRISCKYLMKYYIEY